MSGTARRVRAERLTYLTWAKLHSLERCCRSVRNVPGGVIECGLALGGSGILLATLLGDRRFDGYDVFGMIPPPGERDGADSHERYATIASGRSEGLAGDTYYGYVPDLFDRVQASFTEHGVPVGERIALHKGLFEDTLHPTDPVALAHIDCDWYDPVKLCLERIAPQLSSGGLIVLDDYFDYGGAAEATDEFLTRHPELSVLRDSGHRVLVKR